MRAHGTTRVKRLRFLIEQLLDGSSDEEDELVRVDEHGRHLRRGGWHPTPRQQPGALGMAAWRHRWRTSKLSQLLARTDTYQEDTYGGKLFRSRLSVPRLLFDNLLEEAASYPELKNHQAGDGQGAKGPPCIPLSIKLGGTLYWMRMGGSCLSAADYADIDVQTLRRFSKEWARAVVLHDYAKYVCIPTGLALAEILNIHRQHGFPGMLCGVDGVDVQVTGVPWTAKNSHKGKNSGTLTRNFNVAGNVRRRVFHVHGSHQGSDNDKTMAKFDKLMQSLRTDDGWLGHEKFDLYTTADGDGDPETHRGLWMLTDNGYHAWRCCQFPSKHPANPDDMAWSARGESVRKNASECIFGILKARFRLFAGVYDFGHAGPNQYPARVAHFDNLFRVACMIHNRLQDHDGISDLGSLDSDWKPVNFGRDHRRRLARIRQVAGAGGVLPSGRMDFVAGGEGDEVQYEFAHDALHTKLVSHFAYARERGEVRWMHTAKWSRGLRADHRPLEAGHQQCRDVEEEGGRLYESDEDQQHEYQSSDHESD